MNDDLRLRAIAGRFVKMARDHEGALPKGTRVVRVPVLFSTNAAVGDEGTIEGSLPPVESEFAYIVRWDKDRGAPSFCRGSRLRRL